MTEKRDLKRRVRDRQAEAGESYMTALRHVLSQRPQSNAVPVLEMVDISEIGAPLGMKCAIKMVPALAGQVDLAAMLIQLRDALISTANDAQLWLMRAVVLAGEHPRLPLEPTDPRPFLTRVRAGIGGVSETGRMLALPINGRSGAVMVIFWLWLMPVTFTYINRPPYLIVTTIDQLGGVLGGRDGFLVGVP
jgi:hypothetical protein